MASAESEMSRSGGQGIVDGPSEDVCWAEFVGAVMGLDGPDAKGHMALSYTPYYPSGIDPEAKANANAGTTVIGIKDGGNETSRPKFRGSYPGELREAGIHV